MLRVGKFGTGPLLLLIPAATAFGQASTPVAQSQTVLSKAPDSQPALEEVVVTATGTNISGIQPVGSEALSLSREEILETGKTDLSDVLRQLPQVVDVAPAGVANFREGGTAGYSANNSQGTAINLRGLGAQATLILVDGHRVTPSGTVNVFTEANQVPIAAVQRIEIIDDGNSAIYGSDAVGGVVNYVVRKDLDGVEIGGRGTFVGGYRQYGGSVTGGHTWSSLGSLGKGNFIIGVDYDWRGAMPESSSPFLSDVSRFGGYDNRIRGAQQGAAVGVVNGGVGPGQPGTISTPNGTNNVNWCDNYASGGCISRTYLYRGLPAGSAIPTFAQTSATPSLGDRADETDYLGRRWRYQVTAFYNQDIDDRLSVFFEGFWSKRDTWSAGSQYGDAGLTSVTVNPGSPFYITPPGPAGGPMTINYDYTAHGVPLWYTDNPDTNWTAITGLRVALWHDWTANLSISVGRDRTCGICNIGYHVDSGALQHYVNIGAIDPLSSDPLTSAQLASIMGSNIQASQMGIEDYLLRFDGPLFEVPAGFVRAAGGGEFQHNTEYVQNGASRTQIPAENISEETPPPYEGVGCLAPLPCPPRTQPNEFAWDNISSAGRRITAAFLELYVPLVGAANGLPLVKSLSVDAAGRFDRYSDVGTTTNPKVGLTWAMSSDISVRGSWGTSFRAPSLTDTNPLVYSVKGFIPGLPNYTGDPAIGGNPIPGTTGKSSNVGFLLGDTPGIKPERAHTWSAGLDLTPHWIQNLRISGTYYHLQYTDEIFGPPVVPSAITNPAVYQLYKPYVHPIHNPANCTPGDRSTYDPALLPFLDAVGLYGAPVTPAQACQTQAWIDGRLTNIGSMTQSGLDLNLGYDLDTALGRWSVSLNAVRVLKEDIAALASLPATSVLGQINNLVRWRGRGNVGWRHGPLSATVFLNYVGSYINNTPIAGNGNQTVPSWTTFDMTLGFNFARLSNPGVLKDCALSLSLINMFDRDPPVVLTAGGGQFDANNANLFGRVVQLSVMKKL